MPAVLKLVSPAPAETGSNVSVKLMREEITMVTHDLRNPLACVVSTLELLEAKAAKRGLENEVSYVVRRGLRAAERMEGMCRAFWTRRVSWKIHRPLMNPIVACGSLPRQPSSTVFSKP